MVNNVLAVLTVTVVLAARDVLKLLLLLFRELRGITRPVPGRFELGARVFWGGLRPHSSVPSSRGTER
jgi:hypothetical protein